MIQYRVIEHPQYSTLCILQKKNWFGSWEKVDSGSKEEMIRQGTLSGCPKIVWDNFKQ